MTTDEEKKEKVRLYQKNWRDNNKEKRKAYEKKYYDKNPELHNERSKKYYEDNKEKFSEFNKIYREQNKEEIRIKKTTKITCECGCVVSYNNMSIHRRTKKHTFKLIPTLLDKI